MVLDSAYTRGTLLYVRQAEWCHKCTCIAYTTLHSKCANCLIPTTQSALPQTQPNEGHDFLKARLIGRTLDERGRLKTAGTQCAA